MADNKIEMEPAFFWVCPECMGENFTKMVDCDDQDGELIAEMVEESQLDGFPIDPRMFQKMPETISCGGCGKEYSIDDFSVIDGVDYDED